MLPLAVQQIKRSVDQSRWCWAPSIAILTLKVWVSLFFWTEHPKHTLGSRLSEGAMCLDLHITIVDQRALGELLVW